MSAVDHLTAVYGSFHTLPAELVLEIIYAVPFSPVNLHSLRLTCKRFDALITRYERSLVKDIRTRQFLANSLQLFPSLKVDNYRTLSILHNRLDSLDSLHGQWLRITHHSPELDWLAGRWEGIHKAGLLLLYRLQDHGSYHEKTCFLQSLPKTSLACLFFKLISSIRILRVYGPDPIRGTYGAGDVLARSDIELAFEELLLQHGPDFFVAMLKADESERKKEEAVEEMDIEGEKNGCRCWAVRALISEVDGMLERQSPWADGAPKPATLVSRLRRAFAASVGCRVNENMSWMWEVLSSAPFDSMDEAKLVQVVNGMELKRYTDGKHLPEP